MPSFAFPLLSFPFSVCMEMGQPCRAGNLPSLTYTLEGRDVLVEISSSNQIIVFHHFCGRSHLAVTVKCKRLFQKAKGPKPNEGDLSLSRVFSSPTTYLHMTNTRMWQSIL